jgi:hypothetical protein
MTLADFAALSTSISGIVVTLSLIYLAMQTYQNAKHTKALLQQGQADRVVSTLVAMAQPDIAAAWITGNGGTPTPEAVKGVQFAQLCNALVYDMSDFHNQHVDGLARGEQFRGACVGYSTLLQQPGMRAYWTAWKNTRLQAAPKFIAWVDGLAASPAEGSNPNWI